MKQALEALEANDELINGGRTHGGLVFAMKGIYSESLDIDETNRQTEEAITALRQAIAEAEKQEPVAIGEEWKPCVKLPVVVHVREQRKGETHVSTREGITPVKEDDLIMRGVAGEEYPIGRELFNRTYTFDTAPVHASDISQERVDETAKDQLVPDGTIPISNGGIATSTPTDFFAPPKREWVRLSDKEVKKIVDKNTSDIWCNGKGVARDVEAKLKEKNT
jgi:hypothetical protein